MIALADVLDKSSLKAANERVVSAYGRIDILINGAGGAKKEATTSETLSFFDLPEDAVRWVIDLNLMGTLLPCQVFGGQMAAQPGDVGPEGNACIRGEKAWVCWMTFDRT